MTNKSKKETPENISWQCHAALLSSVKEAVAIIYEGRIEYANGSFVKVFEISRPIHGQKIMDFIAPSDRSLVENRIKRRLQGEQVPHRYQVEGLSELGKRLFFQATSHVIPWKEKTAVQVVLEDLGSIKELERSLEDSRAGYKALVENASDGVVLLNEDGDIEYTNSRLVEMFGYQSSDALIGRPFLTLMSADDRSRVLELTDKNQFNPGKYLTITYIGLRADGSKIPIEALLTKYKTGEQVHIQALLRDVTEREKLLSALSESEERYRTLVEQAMYGVYILQEGRCVYANPTLASMLNYNVMELIGMHYLDIVAPSYHDEVRASVQRRLNGSEPYRLYRFNVLRKDSKEIFVEVSSRNTIHNGRPAVQGMMRDITEQELQAQSLARKNNELNTLFNITSTLSAITDARKAGQILLELIHTLVKAERSFICYVDPDRNIGRIGPSVRVNVDWQERLHEFPLAKYPLITDVMKTGKTLYVPDLRTESRYKPDPKTPQVASWIGVPIKSRLKVIAVIQIFSSQKDFLDEYQIQLLDTIGNQVGFAFEKLLLYEETQAQRKRWEGTFHAIGDPSCIIDADCRLLAANHSLCESVNLPVEKILGTNCKSTLVSKRIGFDCIKCQAPQSLKNGSSTRWEVSLKSFDHHYRLSATPLPDADGIIRSAVIITHNATAQRRTERALSAIARVPHDKAPTILVVDDEEIVRTTCREILATHGYDVILASDGLEAVQIVQSDPNSVDVILLDILLPGMDGEATFTAIRAIRSDIAIMFSTGLNHLGRIPGRPGDLGIDLLVKPYRAEELVEKISSLLQRMKKL